MILNIKYYSNIVHNENVFMIITSIKNLLTHRGVKQAGLS